MATGLGIDIGAEWIKVVQVQLSGKKVTVTRALKLPRLSGPAGEDSPGLTAIPPSLGTELAKLGMSRTGTLGLTGKEVMVKFLTSPPMPAEKLRMFIDMQVGEKLGSGKKGGDDAAPALTYDFRILNVPTGLKGDLVILSAVTKNEYLYGVLAAAKAAKLNPTNLTPSGFGLIQAYLHTQTPPEGETIVLVDVGHETIEVAVMHEENVYFARSGPGGGKKFDQALDKLLKLGMDRAKEFKHARARIAPEGEKLQPADLQFQAALKEAADGIAAAIRSTVMFTRTQAKLPNLDYKRVVLTGGGARLQGLRDYLEKKGGRPVDLLDLTQGINLGRLDGEGARCFEGGSSDMAVATGLAILDANPNLFHLRLVPEAELKKRYLMGTTVWAAAAAVVLLAGLYIPYGNATKTLESSTGADTEFQTAAKKSKARQQEFAGLVVKAKALEESSEYYARQTRLGKVYLELFAKLREKAPAGFRFSGFYQGEGDKLSEGGTWDPFGQPMLHIIVRGYYDVDNEQLKGEGLQNAIQHFFDDIKEIPGVVNRSDNPTIDDRYDGKDLNLPPGFKAVQFHVRLEDGTKPFSEPKKKEPPKPAEGPANPGAGKAG